MKKTTLILITLFFSSIITCFAQNESLVGTWKLTTIDTEIDIPEDQKEDTEQAFQIIIENTTMTFNSDGTSIGNSLDPITGKKIVENSTYTFDGQTIITTDNKGKTNSVTLTNFDGKIMIIKDPDSGLKTIMTFVKQ